MNEVLSGHAAVDQDRGKDPVEDRRLPLDEKRIVEPDREAAEDRNDASDSHSMTSTFLPRSSTKATCRIEATIATEVARITGACMGSIPLPSSRFTIPIVWSMPLQEILKERKKRMTGKRSKSSFTDTAPKRRLKHLQPYSHQRVFTKTI